MPVRYLTHTHTAKLITKNPPSTQH